MELTISGKVGNPVFHSFPASKLFKLHLPHKLFSILLIWWVIIYKLFTGLENCLDGIISSDEFKVTKLLESISDMMLFIWNWKSKHGHSIVHRLNDSISSTVSEEKFGFWMVKYFPLGYPAAKFEVLWIPLLDDWVCLCVFLKGYDEANFVSVTLLYNL